MAGKKSRSQHVKINGAAQFFVHIALAVSVNFGLSDPLLIIRLCQKENHVRLLRCYITNITVNLGIGIIL